MSDKLAVFVHKDDKCSIQVSRRDVGSEPNSYTVNKSLRITWLYVTSLLNKASL